MEEEQNLLSENLERIRNATNDMRVSLDIPNADIETVADVVSTLAPLPPVEESDVCFYDYEGTRVASFTASEFLELEEMPTPPIHTGLIFQGWNWTLEQAKAHILECKMLDIGAHYITDDGKTRFYMNIPKYRTRLTIELSSLNAPVIVDWGDGTVEEYNEDDTIEHNYTHYGKYMITFSSSGTYTILPWIRKPRPVNDASEDYVYKDMLIKVELGELVSINDFELCPSLESVSIPINYDFTQRWFYDGWRNRSSLRFISIPPTCTYINVADFSNSCIEHISLPPTLSSISQNSFSSCFI